MNYKFLLVLVVTVQSVEIPNKVWVSHNLGIVLEPSTLAFHYEDIAYHTVGVEINPGLSNDTLNEKIKGVCALGDVRANVTNAINSAINDIFENVPSQFSDLTTHFCRSTEIDCFLNLDTGKRVEHTTTRPITIPNARKKRFAMAALALIAGLSALGTGIYTYISHLALENHLSMIESHMSRVEDSYVKSLNLQGQYNKVSDDVFIKLYHGVLNNEDLLAHTICGAERFDNYKLTFLDLNFYLEGLRQNIYQSTAGQVSEFLVSSTLLHDAILKKPDFKDTVYQVDPGLFYSLSNSILIKSDIQKRTLYYLLSSNQQTYLPFTK